MAINKFNRKYINSTVITPGSLWYPFSEEIPSNIDIEEKFPLRSLLVENLSSQEIKLILDPIAGSSGKEFQVPDGNTLTLENKDNLTFYQVALQNNGSLDIPINLIKVSVRNY